MDTKLLKQKILDLAIHGKLVPQNSTDEPASKLLERVREERARLISEKKLKPDKNESFIFQADDGKYYEKFADGTEKNIEDEIPFELPNGWSWCRLGNLIYLIGGVSYNKSDISAKGIRILRGGNINNLHISLLDDDVFLTEKYYDSEKQIRLNDIIIVGSTGSHQAIGKAGFVDRNINNTQIGAFLRIIRSIHIELSSYIKILFSTEYYREHIRNLVSGTNINNIKSEYILNFLIPLPPLAEQKRIVEKLEEIFSYINTIENEKVDLENLIKQAKSKILDLAIHGKLVPQDSADEPASALLEKVRVEREEKIKRGEIKRDKKESYIYKNASDNCYYEKFADGREVDITNEIPFEIPPSWSWCRLGEIYEINPRVKANDLQEASFIAMENISAQNQNLFSFTSEKWADIKKNHTVFQDGDICFAKISPCFENGKSFIAKNLINGIGAGTTELIVLRNYLINQKYTYYFIANPTFIHYCCSAFIGVVGQQRIRTEMVKNYFFPLPPLAEQKRIVEKLEEIFSYLDKIALNLV